MFNFSQCELARTLTQTQTSDEQIYREFTSMSSEVKYAASKDIDSVLKAHDTPIDKGWSILQNDFLTIATKYNISSATLFCVFMESKQQ